MVAVAAIMAAVEQAGSCHGRDLQAVVGQVAAGQLRPQEALLLIAMSSGASEAQTLWQAMATANHTAKFPGLGGIPVGQTEQYHVLESSLKAMFDTPKTDTGICKLAIDRTFILTMVQNTILNRHTG